MSPWLPLVLSAALAASGDAGRGRAVYEANCAACHGRSGHGDGPAAAAMRPKPADLASADFWKGRTDAQVRKVIRSGKPGTPMMAFGRLSDRELDDLLAYLHSLSR